MVRWISGGLMSQTLSGSSLASWVMMLMIERDAMLESGHDALGAPAVISLRNISKHFRGALALNEVSLEVGRGEVHALVGHNGSGKSSLVKIISGYHAPDPGYSVQVGGKEVSWPPRDVRSLGIAVVHQSLGLVESVSIVDNYAASLKYLKGPFGKVDWRAMDRHCQDSLRSVGLDVDPNAEVRTLTASERALLAVARSLAQIEIRGQKGGLLVLDEPTVFFDKGEAEQFLDRVRDVAASGYGVIFVSHKITEVLRVSDRISVLRDGRLVGARDTADCDRSYLLNLMFGVDLATEQRMQPADSSDAIPALSVHELRGDTVRGLSFDVGSGEVLGITGLRGMGQDDIPYLLAGTKRRTGTVRIYGKRLSGSSPRVAFNAGLGVVPSDRPGLGLWLDGTAEENLTLADLSRFRRFGRLRYAAQRTTAEHVMRRLGVRPLDPAKRTSEFSGGNQQKILLGKWLIREPTVLVVHEPTQGVDAQTRIDLIAFLRDLASSGTAVVVCSSDYEELALLVDRLIVVRDGRRGDELSSTETTPDRIARACHDVGI
jgi:ribose transport system ATP-binding protein